MFKMNESKLIISPFLSLLSNVNIIPLKSKDQGCFFSFILLWLWQGKVYSICTVYHQSSLIRLKKVDKSEILLLVIDAGHFNPEIFFPILTVYYLDEGKVKEACEHFYGISFENSSTFNSILAQLKCFKKGRVKKI